MSELRAEITRIGRHRYEVVVIETNWILPPGKAIHRPIETEIRAYFLTRRSAHRWGRRKIARHRYRSETETIRQDTA